MNRATKIIINADDLGFSPNVNAAVLRCAERGTITAASVMVNMPFAEEALMQIQQHVPHMSLALHFTLTSGKPVSSPRDIPMLVDTNGLFHLGFLRLGFLLSQKNKSELLQQIQIELSAQLCLMEQLAGKYALRFDHLDSHQHVHVLPGLWELFQQEATSRNLLLRVPRERWGHFLRWRRLFWTWQPQNLLKQAILNQCLRNITQNIGYFGILESGRMDKSALSTIIQSVGCDPPGNVYEINTHPSMKTVENEKTLCCSKADATFHHSPWREREFQALNDNDIIFWAKQHQVLLAGFCTSEMKMIRTFSKN